MLTLFTRPFVWIVLNKIQSLRSIDHFLVCCREGTELACGNRTIQTRVDSIWLALPLFDWIGNHDKVFVSWKMEVKIRQSFMAEVFMLFLWWAYSCFLIWGRLGLMRKEFVTVTTVGTFDREENLEILVNRGLSLPFTFCHWNVCEIVSEGHCLCATKESWY